MNPRVASVIAAFFLVLLAAAIIRASNEHEPAPTAAEPAAEWNAKAAATAAQRARNEPASNAGERSVAREKLRIYENCMKTDKTIKQCADLSGI